MKKFYILAALLLATTSAHAGGISFQYEGKRVTIDAPRGCASLSCINITAPGFNKSNRDDDDDDVAPAPARREYSDSKSKRITTTMIQPAAESPVSRAATSPSATTMTITTRSRSDRAPARLLIAAAPAPVRRPMLSSRRLRKPTSRNRLPRRPRSRQPHRHRSPVAAEPAIRSELAARRLGHRREQGQRPHRGLRRQSLRLCREDRRKDPDQHEAAGLQVGRPDPGSRQRPQIRLDDRDEGQRLAPGSGLRLRRHVLRRPDLEARELNAFRQADKRPCDASQGRFAFPIVND